MFRTKNCNIKNYISIGKYKFTVTDDNRPKNLDFVLRAIKLVQFNGQDEIACVLMCKNADNSRTLYYALYSTTGTLIGYALYADVHDRLVA